MQKQNIVYSKAHAVFQNRILDLYKSMSLDEKRLLVLLSPIVRTTKIKEGQSVFLSADEYAKECCISHTRAYEGLADASKKLVRRYFSYSTEDGKQTVANWILRSTYDEGGVDVYFTDEVLTMLQVFDELNPYTKYKKEIILKLKGDYAFEIYHIAKQNEGLGKTDVGLEQLKVNLDVPKSYHDLSNLKKRVLDPSCEEITKNTDINLSYETVKRGRSVIAIRFIIENKKPKKNNTIKNNSKDENIPIPSPKLTQMDVNILAKKLSKDMEFGSKYAKAGESYEQTEERLRVELTQHDYVKKYAQHITRVRLKEGFKSPK
jgi:plasmid replication initiation protein